MGISIKSFFKFFGKDSKNMTIYENTATEIWLKELAINSAINIIAKLLSNAEIRTFVNGKEIKKDTYYLLNIEPNQNQNATEFMFEWIQKLIYDSEVLIIQENDFLYIADSFEKNDKTFRQTYFRNIIIKDLNISKKNYYMEDVLYLKLGNIKIKKLIDGLNEEYGQLITKAMSAFKKAKGIRGFLKMSTSWAQTQQNQEDLQKQIREKFKTFFNSDDAVVPLEEGFEFTESNSNSKKSNTTTSTEILELMEKIFDIVAIAMNIPKGILKGDVADTSQQTKNLMTLNINTYAKLYEDEINRKMYGKKNYINGSKAKVDISRIEYINIFDVAGGLDVLTRIGFNHNYILRLLKEEPINEEWAEEHYITKNYETKKGGKEIESTEQK